MRFDYFGHHLDLISGLLQPPLFPELGSKVFLGELFLASLLDHDLGLLNLDLGLLNLDLGLLDLWMT